MHGVVISNGVDISPFSTCFSISHWPCPYCDIPGPPYPPRHTSPSNIHINDVSINIQRIPFIGPAQRAVLSNPATSHHENMFHPRHTATSIAIFERNCTFVAFQLEAAIVLLQHFLTHGDLCKEGAYQTVCWRVERYKEQRVGGQRDEPQQVRCLVVVCELCNVFSTPIPPSHLFSLLLLIRCVIVRRCFRAPFTALRLTSAQIETLLL
jgi:hypothetical protein